MKALCHDNRERTFKPGSSVGGWGFKYVQLDHEDLKPEHRDWLSLNVFSRLLPPPEDVNGL